MNVGQLKKVVAKYAKPEGSVADFVFDDIDLLMVALNNARVEAEQLRDFQLSKVVADISIDAYNGAQLDTALLHGTNIPISIKSILGAGVRASGSGLLTAVSIDGLDNHLVRQLEVGSDTPLDYDMRYQGDYAATPSLDSVSLLLQGETLYTNPISTGPGTVFNFELSVYRWLGDYSNDADEDFLTVYCPNYMMWSAIIEVNHLTKQFVPRQEGNLSSPTQLRERAWAAVEKWDDFIVETGRVPRLS